MLNLTELESEALGFRFIGHGTNGSDGLQPGIHLRWSFPLALGFPPLGVTLWRSSVGFPASMVCPGGLPPITNAPPPDKLPVLPGNWPQYFYFQLPCSASRLELHFQLLANSDFYVQLYRGTEVFEPWHIFGEPPGMKMFPFVTSGITGVLVYGNGIQITQLCYHCCSDNAQWTEIQLINGSDLPSGLSAPAWTAFYGIADDDYAVALKRLNAGPADRPISPTDWADLAPVVDQVAQIDGTAVPVGWSVPAGMAPGSPDLPEVEATADDVLQLSLLNRKMALAMGTAWVDTAVPAGFLYHYKLEAVYPPTHMAQLASEFTFEDWAPTDFLYSDIAFGQILLKDLYLPSVVEVESVKFKADQGLAYNNQPFGNTRILVAGSVKEMQLFVTFTSGTLGVNALMDLGAGPVMVNQTYPGPDAIVRLSAQQILNIRLSGAGIVIYRIHYDHRRLNDLKLVAKICGLKAEPPLMLRSPEQLTAEQLPVPPLFDETKTMATRYLAGLRWKYWLIPELRQLPQAIIGYNVLHRMGAAPFTKTNLAGPVYLTQSLNKPYTPPADWPSSRPIYLDAVADRGTHDYQVTALDIWGRESPPTPSVPVLIQAAVPPPPVKLTAKFLDYSTLNLDGTSVDPNLRSDELTWLQANAVDALHLTWQWTETQETICPFVDEFRVHFQHGWLNLFRGTVTTTATLETVLNTPPLGLTAADYAKYPTLEGMGSFETYRFTAALDAPITANGFQMCMLKHGNQSFLVVQNTAGSTPDIWVIVPDTTVGGELVAGKKFTVTLVPESSAFVDYRDAANWTDVTITATVSYSTHTVDGDGNKNYELYIPSPAFPSPAFVPNESRPIRYGQLGVSTVNTDGLEGSVGTPATVMAVNRTAPAALTAASIDYGTAEASPPDAHGKSTYCYRWLKQGLGMKYFVYRAMDDTLIRTDHAQTSRTKADYETLAGTLGVAFDTDTFEFTTLADYDLLNSNQLYVVANMEGNEGAFTRMHKEAIAEDNEDYANRSTETPAVLGSSLPVPNDDYLLFEDNGLDGLGDNYYFYRIRTVDSAGNLSSYSPTTIPIVIPQVVPAVKPAISAITGGENQITVTWEQKTHPDIAGYNLYRTTDANKAGDWRRMTWVRTAEAEYTVTVDPEVEVPLTFTDLDVVARVPYYYGVVAITLDAESQRNRSTMSVIRTAQAYDLTAPAPPTWDETNSGWVYVDDNGTIFEWEDDLGTAVNPVAVVRLVWEHNSSEYSISKSTGTSAEISVMAWGEGEEYDATHRYVLDTSASAAEWTYSIGGKSAAGLISASKNKITITQ